MEILAFTGAGISKASGIPTFEEMPSIRKKLSRDYANNNPEDYRLTIDNFNELMEKANPNNAHLALAKYNARIITMNVDKLHQKAGSQNVIELHGSYPDYVLYGDEAPKYMEAKRLIKKELHYKQFIFLVIGTSFYTGISQDLFKLGKQRAIQTFVIDDNAETKVQSVLLGIKNKYKLEG